MSVKAWIKQKMPGKILSEPTGERYVHQDWDIPPDPANLIRMGLAATPEEAQVLIAKDKTLWGGTRKHYGVDDIQTKFGSLFPATLALGAKPTIYEKFSNAPDNDPDYQEIWDAWKQANIIV